MPNSRFPRTRMTRELTVLHKEMADWRASYLDAAAHTDNAWLADRFTGRAYVLEDAMEHCRVLVEVLHGMPRIA